MLNIGNCSTSLAPDVLYQMICDNSSTSLAPDLYSQKSLFDHVHPADDDF